MKGSAIHWVNPMRGSGKQFPGRIDKRGRLFVNGFCMTHSEEEHEKLYAKHGTWYTFYCNTAVRSFSEQGVD